jgi:hypothetical protein
VAKAASRCYEVICLVSFVFWGVGESWLLWGASAARFPGRQVVIFVCLLPHSLSYDEMRRDIESGASAPNPTEEESHRLMCSCWDSLKRGGPGRRRALLELGLETQPGTALIKIHKLSGSSPWCPCCGRAFPGFQGSAERLGKPLPTRRVQHSSVCCALPSLLVEEIFIPRSTRELKQSRTSGREKGCTSSSSGIHIYPRPRF